MQQYNINLHTLNMHNDLVVLLLLHYTWTDVQLAGKKFISLCSGTCVHASDHWTMSYNSPPWRWFGSRFKSTSTWSSGHRLAVCRLYCFTALREMISARESIPVSIVVPWNDGIGIVTHNRGIPHVFNYLCSCVWVSSGDEKYVK